MMVWSGDEPPIREVSRRDVLVAVLEVGALLAIVGALLLRWRSS